jgi:hypothetical protein
MASHFEIFKDARGGYRFHLKAANGEIIAAAIVDAGTASCMVVSRGPGRVGQPACSITSWY